VTFAEDVIDQPARAQFEVFLDEHRGALNGCLDGLTEEQVRRSLVPSRTALLGLVKHAAFVEKVWVRRSRHTPAAGPGILVPTANTDLFGWCLTSGLRIVQLMTLMTIGLYNQPAGSYLPSILH
jgi:hypothetical protein